MATSSSDTDIRIIIDGLAHLKPPTLLQSIHREECTQCFDTQVRPQSTRSHPLPLLTLSPTTGRPPGRRRLSDMLQRRLPLRRASPRTRALQKDGPRLRTERQAACATQTQAGESRLTKHTPFSVLPGHQETDPR